MSNEENIEYDECGEIKKPYKDCKYFHADPYKTPNNYDLYFNYNEVPVNIEMESNVDLKRRLKKHLPLSKILHINMESDSVAHNEELKMYTQTRLRFTRAKEVNGKVVGNEDVVVELK